METVVGYGTWQQSIERKINNLQTRCSNLEATEKVYDETINKLIDRLLEAEKVIGLAAERIGDLVQEVVELRLMLVEAGIESIELNPDSLN